jgi:hypothetical protein
MFVWTKENVCMGKKKRLWSKRRPYVQRRSRERHFSGNKDSLQNLNAVIATITNNNAAIRVNQNAARSVKLPIFAPFFPDGSNMRAVSVSEYLHTVVLPFGDEDVASAIEGDANRAVELARAGA